MPGAQQIIGLQLAGRLLLLCLLGLALWNPVIPWRSAPARVVVVLDDSLSMDQPFLTSAWSRFTGMLGALPTGSRYTLVRFANHQVVEISDGRVADLQPDMPVPRTLPLDPSATSIEAALELALGLTEPDSSPLLVLISDAGETRGQADRALRQAKSAAIPVFLLAPETDSAGTDARIEAIRLPNRTRIGRRISLGITLSSNYDGNGRIQVYLNSDLVAQQAVILEAGQVRAIQVTLTPESTGPQEIVVSLDAAGDTFDLNNKRTAVINVNDSLNVLYITNDIARVPVADSLIAGGWSVHVITPGEFMQHAGQLPTVATVILDDIATSTMSEQAWRILARAVRANGTGLVVLGGPRSFGAGGYRNSTLEKLLPVTSEARDPASQAAVLFLVDKSGSMDNTDGSASRFAYARKAVLGTADSLHDGDLTGLLAFDAEPHSWLPLDSYRNPVQSLENAWRIPAAGGTRIKPALQNALAQLGDTEADQRLLVIVTDGFVADEDFSDLLPEIDRAGIDIIALAVGREPELELLGELSSMNAGALLRVHDSSTLPDLMNAAVGVRRSAYEAGTIKPRELRPLPFLAGNNPVWPPLQGYMVTRERPGVDVYLRSDRGDPLLATHYSGTGSVTVLPAGLGQWASAWHNWSLWGRLLGGLIEWTGGQGGDPYLHIAIDDQPGACRIVIDAITEDNNWNTATALTLTLRDPFNRLVEINPEHTAPGRYTATLPVRQTGRYRVTVRAGENTLQHEFLHTAAREIDAHATSGQRIRSWLNAGIIRDWPDNDRIDMAAVRHNPLPLRLPLLLLALAVYCGLLLVERFPVSLHSLSLHTAAGLTRAGLHRRAQ